jgi:uncharacterized protein YbaA (DUF1428 family)
MAYIQGFLAAVPEGNKEAYRKMAVETWDMFKGYGALSMRENWGVDVPDGKVTSFPMATKKKDDEVVIFSWIIWPDRATCDAAAKKMEEEMGDMSGMDMPFDGMRMMWGGFEELVDVSA